MANIRPLKAWRYNPQLSEKIDELTSPLFDVVSEEQRQALYDNPLNSIHLSVPLGSRSVTQTLSDWKTKGIIVQDSLPAIYVYYQHFTLPGSKRSHIRKGFICNLTASNWDEKEILRHENTMPHSVNDRLKVLEDTKLNVSATHGLYFDNKFELETYMDESMLNPLYETEDYQGVKDVLAVIHDHEIIKKFIQLIEKQNIILADGHHRYESSMIHREREMKSNPNHTGEEAYNFHMMYLTNAEADDLRILPTQRIISNLKGFNQEEFLNRLEEYFILKPIHNPNDLNEIILGKKWAFGLLIGDVATKVRLKPEAHELLDWDFPDEIKELDLTVMHYFIIEKGLGIPGKEHRNAREITFERNFSNCLSKTKNGEAQIAIITQEIEMEEVKRVCYSGFTLPQKSTSFYPKAICGYLFSSIRQDEFELPVDLSF